MASSVHRRHRTLVDGTWAGCARLRAAVEIARKLPRSSRTQGAGWWPDARPVAVHGLLAAKGSRTLLEYEASLRRGRARRLSRRRTWARGLPAWRARPRVTSRRPRSSRPAHSASRPSRRRRPQGPSLDPVDPAPVQTIPVEAVPEPRSSARELMLEPEPVQEALPDVLVAPGLDPDGSSDCRLRAPQRLRTGARGRRARARAGDRGRGRPRSWRRPSRDAGGALPDVAFPGLPGFPQAAPPARAAPFLPCPRRCPLRRAGAASPRARAGPAAPPRPDPVPETIVDTRTVSAAEAARAGLAHAADALLVDVALPALRPVTTLGRSSACDVPLDDASASRGTRRSPARRARRCSSTSTPPKASSSRSPRARGALRAGDRSRSARDESFERAS